jgi:hypothetical protein
MIDRLVTAALLAGTMPLIRIGDDAIPAQVAGDMRAGRSVGIHELARSVVLRRSVRD